MIKSFLILVLLAFGNCYNQSRAIDLAKLSVITHCANEQIQNWNCQLCKTYPHLTHITVIENTITHIKGFIAYDSMKKSITISWRGTQDIKNWVSDLDFKQIAYQGAKCVNCKIHQGFYNAYVSVSGKINDKVKELMSLYPTATITLTGHSLGGAIALVGALFLHKDYSAKLTELYLYGCPRVGNGNLAAYIHLIVPNIYRVIHYKDEVPHLPPNDFNYLHPPFEVLYDQPMKTYVVCNDSGQDRNCSNKYAPLFTLSDHTFYWYKTDSSIC